MLVIASEGQGIWCEHFLRHLSQVGNLEIIFEKSNRSNLILRSLFLGQEQEFPKSLPYICWSGEPLTTSERSYPPLFTIWSVNKPTVPFFIVVFFDYFATLKIQPNLKNLSLYSVTNRPYFLAYCASRATSERETLFRLLQQKDKTKTCHGLGKCQPTPSFHDDKTFHNLRNTYSSYRFTIAMENSVIPGYVTEKLLNAMLAGSIPIYYGDSVWVKKVFNENAIIFVQDFVTLEECANYIVHIDETPELLKLYQSQKHFIKDEYLGYFSSDYSVPKEYQNMIDLLKTITG